MKESIDPHSTSNNNLSYLQDFVELIILIKYSTKYRNMIDWKVIKHMSHCHDLYYDCLRITKS